tara:strand:- start:68 stop:445 length:378 start_codon:yes stop_codon:yes gene_type:complete
MKIHEIILPNNTDCEMEAAGVGKIVKGVNTTADVKPGETERQAKKFFGGTGKPKLLTKKVKETATAGATSAGAIATVVNPTTAKAKIKRDRNGVPKAPQKLNPDGTAKNALNLPNNIMGGKPIKR